MLQGVCYQKVLLTLHNTRGNTTEPSPCVMLQGATQQNRPLVLPLCYKKSFSSSNKFCRFIPRNIIWYIPDLLIILAGLLIFITLNILTYFCQCVNNKCDKNGTSPCPSLNQLFAVSGVNTSPGDFIIGIVVYRIT